MKADYLKQHNYLLYYYTDASEGGWYLGFEKSWQEEFLPKSSSHDLIVTLLDQSDGKTYSNPIHTAYDDCLTYCRKDSEYLELNHLMPYVYGSHYCSCHRKTDARNAGAIVKNEDCEGNRFLIQSIMYQDLILCSETMSIEELEAKLND